MNCSTRSSVPPQPHCFAAGWGHFAAGWGHLEVGLLLRMHHSFSITNEELQGDSEWISTVVRMVNKISGEKVMVRFIS